jgi:hypothetical protein
MNFFLYRLESNLSGSIICPQKTTPSNYDGIFQEKSFQLLSERVVLQWKNMEYGLMVFFVVLICIQQHIKLFYRKELRQSPRRDIATIESVIILYCKCNMHSTDACKNIMHESVWYWLIIIGGQLFTGLHDLLMRQEEGGYILHESGSMAGYLKHPHVFERRTLCVLESQGLFWCEILSNADFFFSCSNWWKIIVFWASLLPNFKQFFIFIFIIFWDQILPQVAVGSQKYRRILDFYFLFFHIFLSQKSS